MALADAVSLVAELELVLVSIIMLVLFLLSFIALNLPNRSLAVELSLTACWTTPLSVAGSPAVRIVDALAA